MHDTLTTTADVGERRSQTAATETPAPRLPDREELRLTDTAELAVALQLSERTVQHWAKEPRLRFGKPVRPSVGIYFVEKLSLPDREALEKIRAQSAIGTRDFIGRRVFHYRERILTETDFTLPERGVGEQRAKFCIQVELNRREQAVDYQTAVDLIKQTEETRAGRGSDLHYPLLVGKLTWNNFRKWKERWNPWRDSDLDESQWWCLCPRYRLDAQLRRSDFVDTLRLTATETNAIRYLVLHTDSQPEGLRLYTRDPRCRGDVRAAILSFLDNQSGSIPPSLERAIFVPEEYKLAFRSKKRFRQHAFSQNRGLWYHNSTTGEAVPLTPGDCSECDDMTVNQPFWFEWPFGGDPCSDRYGVRVGRGQLLLDRDLVSGKYLSYLLLMRWRDSYRSTDIFQWRGRTYRVHGMPRVAERLERGVWKAKLIDGVQLMQDDGTLDARFGGLSELGFEVVRTFGPKGKAIEQPMDMIQKILGMFGVQVGRTRGEFEVPTKDLIACQAGHRDPRECGFLHGDVLGERIFESLTHLNTRKIRGRLVHGVPDELWAQHVNNDNPRKPIPRDKEWLFLPDWAEVTIRDGCIPVWRTAGDRQTLYPFEISEFVRDGLGHGYRVRVFFDPHQPELGAWVFNNETRPCNMNNWPLGHFIGIAPLIADAPQFRIGDGSFPGDQTAARKRYADAYRSSFAALGLFGKKLAHAREASDGQGNTTRIETGTPSDPMPASVPAPSERRAAIRERNEHIDAVANRVSADELKEF